MAVQARTITARHLTDRLGRFCHWNELPGAVTPWRLHGAGLAVRHGFLGVAALALACVISAAYGGCAAR